MDRAGKSSIQSNERIESTGGLEKEKSSGTTKTGKNVNSVSEENKTPINESHRSSTPLFQRTGEIAEPAELFLKKTDVSDSLAASESMKSGSDQLEVSDQIDFDSLLILADIDPFLGLDEASVASVLEEFANWNHYTIEGAKPENDHNTIELYLVEEKIKLLLGSTYLDNFTRCLIQQMKSKNISLKNVSKEVFKEEINILLKDMRSRGIGLSSKIRIIGSPATKTQEKSKHKFYASPSSYSEKIEMQNKFRLAYYNRFFSQLPEFDTKLEEFLNSDQCVKWDSNQPIYRGGDISLERKLFRNIEKGKAPFRTDLINRGMTQHGFGQYYSSSKATARLFAMPRESPVVVSASIKPGTPVVNYEEVKSFFKEESQSNVGAEKLTWKEYLSYFCNQPIIVRHVTSTKGVMLTCTLPHGEVIDHIEMVAVGDFANLKNYKAVTDLSIHRLGEDRLIVGHPINFEKVEVSKETQLESTGYEALGHPSGKALPVSKTQINEKDVYVVPSPELKNEYLLVKQLPESLKDDIPTFILEPSRDFLLLHKKEKMDKLQNIEHRTELEKQAEHNTKIVKNYFDILCV